MEESDWECPGWPFFLSGKLAKKSRERFGKIGKKLIHQDQILDKLSKLGKSQS